MSDMIPVIARYEPDDDNAKGVVGPSNDVVKKAVSVEVIRDNLTALCAQMDQILSNAWEVGQFQLDEVQVVPIPNNPATEKPFIYRLENDTAVLDLPKSDGFSYARRYEITLRK